MDRLTLKFGTVKGWDLESDAAKKALDKWASYGVCAGCATHVDTEEQKKALFNLIEHMDEIYLAWDGISVSREEAKEYVKKYGKC
jgi:hypothetical protein